MIRTGKAFAYAAAAASLLCLPAGARAAVITTSGSAPGAAGISQPDFSAAAFNGSQDFTDNAGPPGQTFTATAATPALSAFTLKGFANTGALFGGNVNAATTTWTITVSRVDSGNVLTQLARRRPARWPSPAAATTSRSRSPRRSRSPPAPSTRSTCSPAGYFGFAKSSTDVYAGGAAIQHGTTSRTAANGATIANLQAVDRTFFVNPVAAPEPASLALAALPAAAGLLARRRSCRRLRRPG